MSEREVKAKEGRDQRERVSVCVRAWAFCFAMAARLRGDSARVCLRRTRSPILLLLLRACSPSP